MLQGMLKPASTATGPSTSMMTTKLAVGAELEWLSFVDCGLGGRSE